MREGVVPAVVVAAAVIGFVAYLSFQGSTHAVDYAVTGADVMVVPADDRRLPAAWRQRAAAGPVMVVEVSWQAGESLAAGSYAVLVTAPRGWGHLGCRPECEWSDGEGLREFARRLPRRTYPLGAVFGAEETGSVRVAFRPPPGGSGPPESFVPTAWLVQTNGDDALGARQVPLS